MMIPQRRCEGILYAKKSPEREYWSAERLPGKRCVVICFTVRDSVLASLFLAAESVSAVPESLTERYFWAGRCLDVEVMTEEWFT